MLTSAAFCMDNKPLHLTLLLIIIGNNLWAQRRNLIINEVCVANTDAILDPAYNYGGWIELYNPTSNQITLEGMYISDDGALFSRIQVPWHYCY